MTKPPLKTLRLFGILLGCATPFVVIAGIVFITGERDRVRWQEAERARVAAEQQRVMAEREADLQKRRAAREAKEDCEGRAQLALDQFQMLLAISPVPYIEDSRVECIGTDAVLLTLTVSEVWLIRPPQLKLLDAQDLHIVWASVADPEEPLNARLRILDRNGNRHAGNEFGFTMQMKDR